MRYFTCLFSLFLASCGTVTAPIYLDHKFTDEELILFEEAAEEWFDAIPEARTDIHIGGRVNVIREDGSSISGIYAESLRIRMWFWPDIVPDGEFKNVVLHELAHYLGSWTHFPNGEATNHYGSVVPDCISAADIAHVCDGRGGCREATFPNCD